MEQIAKERYAEAIGFLRQASEAADQADAILRDLGCRDHADVRVLGLGERWHTTPEIVMLLTRMVFALESSTCDLSPEVWTGNLDPVKTGITGGQPDLDPVKTGITGGQPDTTTEADREELDRQLTTALETPRYHVRVVGDWRKGDVTVQEWEGHPDNGRLIREYLQRGRNPNE